MTIWRFPQIRLPPVHEIQPIQLLGTHIFGNLGTSSEAKVDTVEPDEPVTVEPETVEPETGGRGWCCVPKIVPWRM